LNHDIEAYNALQTEDNRRICTELMTVIMDNLPDAVCKIWHGSPVWFIEGNPIVGYSKLKHYVQLLFWSGASFDEDLELVGTKFKTAQVRYLPGDVIDVTQLKRLLKKAQDIQWDYKNIVKRRGVLERLK